MSAMCKNNGERNMKKYIVTFRFVDRQTGSTYRCYQVEARTFEEARKLAGELADDDAFLEMPDAIFCDEITKIK